MSHSCFLSESSWRFSLFFFCFRAEDGIRYFHVTGVQTCALPIWNDQIPPFEKRVAGERRQGGRASIPAEMVELVALVGHHYRVDDLAKSRGAGLHVDH